MNDIKIGEPGMNKFELFTMVFYALNHYWETKRNETVGDFLSDMNPFLWDDNGSADPAFFEDFCKVIKNDNIAIEDSFAYAKKYVESIDNEEVKSAFSWVTEQTWKTAVNKYLKSNHKGAGQ